MAEFFGRDIFKLGFGLMRLPKDADGVIDVAETAEMVDRFIEAGGNYFDTAFVYNGSEEAIRKALVERARSILTSTCCTRCSAATSTTTTNAASGTM